MTENTSTLSLHDVKDYISRKTEADRLKTLERFSDTDLEVLLTLLPVQFYPNHVETAQKLLDLRKTK